MSGSACLFGVDLDLFTMDELVDRCCELVERGGVAQQTSLNASKVVLMADDRALFEAVRDSDIVTADGQSVVWAGRLLGARVPERVPGIDLMGRLLEVAEQRCYPVFFLGAQREVLERFSAVAQARFPNLKVAGKADGFYSSAVQIAEEVDESGARLLFIAMPSPRKEYFVRDQSCFWSNVLAVGVGGSFDVWAGVTTRAPDWMQKAGLEWFYRFLQEPKRMWKRYLVGNGRFTMLMLREYVLRLTGNKDDREGGAG